MNSLDDLMKKAMSRIIQNRWDYTEGEMKKAASLGFFKALGPRATRYWIVAEPVYSAHCAGGHCVGRPLYFDPTGMLIKHKCPPGICPHAVSQLSPLIYNYYDHLLRGKNPDRMIFKHVTCTDPGLEHGGMGHVLFKLSHQKMPITESARFALSMAVYLILKNRRAGVRSKPMNETARDAVQPDEFTRALPVSEEELEMFLASPERAKRLLAAKRFRDHRIVVKVVSSEACIAGHKAGDEILIDSRGVILPKPGGTGICIMALSKAWWRVILMLERIAEAAEEGGDFEGPLFDLPISCYGAGLPLGACGEIKMTVELRERQLGIFDTAEEVMQGGR